MKILCAIPYTDNRLFDQTIDCALSLHIPKGGTVDYLFLRGNGDDNDITDRRQKIVRKRNQARDAAISGNYDYLFFIDSDVVFHPDVLERLHYSAVKYNADVTYGLFCVRKEPYWWACAIMLHQQDNGVYGEYLLSSDKDGARQLFNEEALIVEAFGMPYLKVEALANINFRYVEDSHQFEDYWLGYDMKQAGKLQVCNLQARFGHILTDCKRVVWPSDNDDLYVIKDL